MIGELILVFLPILLLIVFHYVKNQDETTIQKTPPGPFQWPYFGNMLIGNDEDVAKMQKKYGDVFMIKFGVAKFVYIADYKLTKEAFVKPEFSARFPWKITWLTEIEKKEQNSYGVILGSGSRWNHNRRFVLRHLKDLGMGTSRMEEVILRETESILDEFKTLADKPSDIPFVIQLTVLNVVWEMVAGHRYTTEDIPSVEKFINTFKTAEEVFSKVAMVEVFPVLRMLPNFILNKFKINSFPDCIRHMNEHMKPFIEEHKESLDVENPRDFIDDYLVAMKKDEGNEESYFNEDDLYNIIFDLFIAGMDTTSITLKWFLLFMAKHQEEQSKCQEVLDSVVGDERLPRLEHRNRLAYIDATVNEVLRMSSLANFHEWHYTTEDTSIKDFFIPKGTTVLSAAGFIHKDPRYWKDPLKFDPSRFINSDGKFIPQKEGFVPFGIGRRSCIGETLARMELFLMCAATIKNFTISPCDGETIDLEPKKILLGRFPKDQKLIFSPRN